MKEKFILVQWPEIQLFQEEKYEEEYFNNVYYASDVDENDCWFVKEEFYNRVIEENKK